MGFSPFGALEISSDSIAFPQPARLKEGQRGSNSVSGNGEIAEATGV